MSLKMVILSKRSVNIFMEIDIVVNDFEMGGAQINWLRLLNCKSHNNIFKKK